MKWKRTIGVTAAVMLVLTVVVLLTGVFQRLLIGGSRLIDNLGDIELPETAYFDEDESEMPTAAAQATWPPGDDPSWNEEMPLVPVDMTAAELADDEAAQSRENRDRYDGG